MKTFGFFVVLSMLFFTNAFGGACVPMLCDESEHDVDEMLTENGVTGGVNNKNGRFTSQMCFMCDTGGDSECNYGDTVAVVDNYGNVKNAWQCTNDAGVDDSWISYNIDTLPICGDSPLNATNTNMNNAKPITKVFITWVPWSSHGMTEFFCKNSVFIYCIKLAFAVVFMSK